MKLRVEQYISSFWKHCVMFVHITKCLFNSTNENHNFLILILCCMSKILGIQCLPTWVQLACRACTSFTFSVSGKRLHYWRARPFRCPTSWIDNLSLVRPFHCAACSKAGSQSSRVFSLSSPLNISTGGALPLRWAGKIPSAHLPRVFLEETLSAIITHRWHYEVRTSIVLSPHPWLIWSHKILPTAFSTNATASCIPLLLFL